MNDIWHTALAFSLQKIEQSIPLLEDFPDRCYGPAWGCIGKKKLSSNWVGGFWVGQLWLVYAYTKDPKFEAAVREWMDGAWLKTTLETHDLGFIFYLSNVLDAYATGNEAIAIMTSLWENYAAQNDDMASILKHATHFERIGNADHGLIYGDYYFLETLLRVH